MRETRGSHECGEGARDAVHPGTASWQDAEKIRQPVLFIWSVRSVWFVWSISFIWFVLFVWLNATNQIDSIDQKDQMNQINRSLLRLYIVAESKDDVRIRCPLVRHR